ncbi:hypothetical protein TGARI_233830B, partial [Toxoplasma gondii ARI]
FLPEDDSRKPEMST